MRTRTTRQLFRQWQRSRLLPLCTYVWRLCEKQQVHSLWMPLNSAYSTCIGESSWIQVLPRDGPYECISSGTSGRTYQQHAFGDDTLGIEATYVYTRRYRSSLRVTTENLHESVFLFQRSGKSETDVMNAMWFSNSRSQRLASLMLSSLAIKSRTASGAWMMIASRQRQIL